MSQPDLPLLELFNRLRNSNVPLGMDEYFLALRALEGGFGLDGWASLARMCRALWIKDEESERKFAHHFKALVEESLREEHRKAQEAQRVPTTQTTDPTSKPDEDSEPSTTTRKKTGEQTPSPKEDPKSVKPDPDKVEKPGKGESELNLPKVEEFVYGIEDEMEGVRTVQLAPLSESSPVSSYFRFSGNYLPVTRRQMKQSWRYLRQFVREGPPVEIDVDATVRRAAADGMLLDVVLRPRRINRAELLLLLDQNGSMTPFHPLSRRLVETVTGGGQLGHAGVYYFHDVPYGHLYTDSTLVEHKPIPDLLNQLNRSRTAVLIFSDAGAARRSYDEERITRTHNFIQQLKQAVDHVVWLNPMPPVRWAGSSADVIQRFLPMLAMTRRGLHDAITILRGVHVAQPGGSQ